VLETGDDDGVRSQSVRHSLHEIAAHTVVGVYEHDGISSRRADAAIAGVVPALTGRGADDTKAGQAWSEPLGDRGRVVRRPVVDHDHLPLRRRSLGSERRQLVTDLGGGVVAGKHDGQHPSIVGADGSG